MSEFQQYTPPMDNMDLSPADSLLADPKEAYSPLFPVDSPVMNPQTMMTPSSVPEEALTPSRLSVAPETASSPAGSDKKPTKKRKTWGQVLPEPKTNLPPRKRAKTEDEKEQRRVERVLRNRRAAQSSRERKRLEVEALETKNKDLETKIQQLMEQNKLLMAQLGRSNPDSGVVGATVPSGSPLENTLSTQLFTSDSSNLDTLVSTTNPTVDPSSLSPKPTPEATIIEPTQSTETTSAASNPVMTQRPAAMLCDLQCQTGKEPRLSDSRPLALLMSIMMLASTSLSLATRQPLTWITTSLKMGWPIPPSPQILTTILLLVTCPRSSRTSSSSRTGRRQMRLSQLTSALMRVPLTSIPSSTLRIKLLKKILASSPTLARPLKDATLRALRLVSESNDASIGLRIGSGMSQEADDLLTRCLKSVDLPSREILLTLLWTLKLEQKRLEADGHNDDSRSRQESSVAQSLSRKCSFDVLGATDGTHLSWNVPS